MPAQTAIVSLPSTVEEHFWGAFGTRPVGACEYFFNTSDPVPESGVYEGVSWWWTTFRLPPEASGRRVRLVIPAARQRAEVFVNERLAGYDIIAETPFDCDVTAFLKEGENRLAIRITNPGGRLDWMDFVGEVRPKGPFPPSAPLTWGGANIPYGHGFGGLDSGVRLEWMDDIHIADIFVHNRPDPCEVVFDVEFVNDSAAPRAARLLLEVSAQDDAATLIWARTFGSLRLQPGSSRLSFPASLPLARLWSPESPYLHSVRALLSDDADDDVRGFRDDVRQSFGLRWLTVGGLGTKARLDLNGARRRLRSAISWNYWALNGLFPRPALLDAETRAAKALGLNMVSCHRNIGNTRSFEAFDRAGLFRWEEPGAGRNAWSEDLVARAYMREKFDAWSCVTAIIHP